MIYSKKDTGSKFLIKNYLPQRPIFRGLVSRIIFILILGAAGAGLEYISGNMPLSKEGMLFSVIPVSLGVIIALTLRRMYEWERAIVLRFGKFYKVKGPGIFFIIPFIDQIARIVDLRIRVSDFTAETTLSKDSATVTVDALCFWLVWDAEKAVLEVQNYEEAVILSSKTALRQAVSTHDLSVFLEKNEMIEEYVCKSVDKKTTDWGITVLHIEITDIQIPEHLQDSLSRIAQAEREKKGRILLAEAEIQIAKKLEEAAKIYSANDIALLLKNLSILNEGLKAGNSMMLVPNSITEKLEGNDIFGLQALNELKRDKKERDSDKKEEDK
jgi:regulator of protease activity HflC (stomatin/prohibitin superfamily)